MWHDCNSNDIDDTYEWEWLISLHSFASWLCDERIKLWKVYEMEKRKKKEEKIVMKSKGPAVWGELRRERDP